MRFSTPAVFLTVSSLLGAAVAHNIQLAAHGRECFHEQLHKDDKMTVTFQVGDREFGSAGNLDIDFWVSKAIAILAHLCASCCKVYGTNCNWNLDPKPRQRI